MLGAWKNIRPCLKVQGQVQYSFPAEKQLKYVRATGVYFNILPQTARSCPNRAII